MANYPTTPPPNRTIPDPWLPAARVGWLILAIVVLTIHILGMPIYYEQLMTPLDQPDMPWEQPKPADAEALTTLGISLTTYARFLIAHVIIYSVVMFAMGTIIFWRRSHDLAALLASCALIAFSLGENSTDHVLKLFYPIWHWPVEGIQMFSVVTLFWFGYLFPTGYFVPHWSRWLAYLWAGLMMLCMLFPEIPFNPLYGETADRTPLLSALLFTGYALTTVFAQVYRYRSFSTAEQRLQTRWIVLAFLAMNLMVVVRYFPSGFYESLREPGLGRMLHVLVAFPLGNWFPLTVPVAMLIAIMRYRLWVVDLILNRAMVYTIVTITLALFYMAGIWLLQWILGALTTGSSTAAVVITTAAAALLFAPIRNMLQQTIDRTFQRDQLDVQTAFRTLQQEIRTIIDLPELLQRLVTRISAMLHATHGAIYLAESPNRFTLAQQHGTATAVPTALPLPADTLAQLQQGLAVKQATATPHTLLVPLTAPQTDLGDALVGILALGRRSNGQPYGRSDLILLETMGVQAGTAITVARLVAVEQEQAAWRRSPAGRAATLAAELPTAPQALLSELHALATLAHDDLETAHTLRHLADAFRQRGAPLAATLANGYYFLATGHREPATVIVGLRTLVTELEKTPSTVWPEAATFHQPLAALLAGLEAVIWTDILSICPPITDDIETSASVDDAVAELKLAQQSLQSAVAGLAPYEQTTTADEQLGLLVQTLDQLSTLIHYLPGALSPPLQALVQRVAEHWSMLLTRQAAALRRQAQVVATLHTRQLFAPKADDDGKATVLLTLVNQGRGEATDVRVTATTAVNTGSDDSGTEHEPSQQRLARLLPGERHDLALTFVPTNLSANANTESSSQPLHFVIHYSDEEAADKTIHYREVVHLLPIGGQFQTIPNPYVAGAPLRPHSRTFVGRHGDLQFIVDALAVREGNMAIVLTGERRMGKTSLLQQLLVGLEPWYVPVYLDCQALAIEPGLQHLLFDLAEAITEALSLPAPNASDFAIRPSAFFERTFLPQIEQTLGKRRLLLLFDEFEELEARVDRERLEPEFFPYLRHLIQHNGLATATTLTVLFAGTHQLHELNPAYWSAFFNVAHHRRLSFLQPKHARTLILKPVAPHLHYDDLALEQMLRLTGGHPYFLQLLCHSIVNAANRDARSYVTLSHIHRAVEGVFELAASHLLYLWSGVAEEHRALLVAAARVAQDGISFDGNDVRAQFVDQPNLLSSTQVTTILHQFVAQEILQLLPHSQDRYRFTFDLLRRWIARQMI